MRYLLLASTCCVALASGALAETSVTTKQTTPIRTSTIKQGAADDIKITSAGSVELTTGGAAVTIDTANKLTNEGTIQITNADNATGILAQAGTSGGISLASTAKVIVDETYAPTDGDNDGDLDGPFALGTNRIGIATAGAYNGAITIANGATITVEGNNSFGIKLGGPLTGNFSHDGTTTVTGNNAIGIEARDVTGSVRLAGAIGAVGDQAVAAWMKGNISGTLTVQGTLASTGYRYTTAPADPSKLDADDKLIGGSALIVEGNVAGGIILAVPPKDNSATDNDEDKDGIEDSKEGSAVVRSYGSAAAMRIGAADHDIAIGAVPGTGSGYGLIIDGVVAGSGLYADIAARGLHIGGLGGAVTIAGGIGIGASGNISASAVNASATALRFGTGASTPLLHNMGRIEASGSNAANTMASAVVIDEGATLPAIRNAGTIKATATGENGAAVGIVDFSRTVSLIENSGTISATGAKADSGRNVAIDVSGTSTGVIVRQTAVAAGVAAPNITGNILFGAGNDLLDIADGTVKGDTVFGAGADVLKLSGDAIYEGNVSFGTGGATMSLAGTSGFKGKADFGQSAGTLDIATGTVFSGSILNSQNVALTLSGGGLDLTAPTSISSLAVTNKGIIAVTLGQAGNTTPIIAVSGTASFAADSKLALRITDVEKAEGNHLVLSAGTLTGANNITSETTLVPFLYKATLANAGNNLTVTVGRKTKSELGLNQSEGAAFDAVYAALTKDDKVEGAFLGLTGAEGFRATLRQMLPDHAGGTFTAVTQGSRAFGRMLSDPTGPFKDEGNWGYWVNQLGWGQNKAIDATSGFDITGWGIGAGAEYKTGLGNFGVSLAYLWSRNSDKGSANQVRANQYEIASYWRLKSGGFRASARGAVAFIDLAHTRSFEGTNGSEKVSLTSHGDNGARLWSGAGTLSYETITRGGISFRPVLSVDYYRLFEKSYAETGGGKAFDLIVRSRKSDELAVTGSAVVGIDAGGEDQYAGWSRIEIEGGRRQIVSGNLGNTVARFADGDNFTLLAAERDSGWIGRLRGVAGNSNFSLGGEFSAEQQQGALALALRASIRVGL